MKTCYYELLGVEPTATDSEIKKAYRKKALLLHPDKNPHDVAGANARFTLISAAYEVLADPQERSWYDAHKSLILRDEEDFTSDAAPEMVIPSVTVDELLRYFNPELYSRLDDSLGGFYSAAGRLFEKLAAEEVRHAKYQRLEKYELYMDDAPNANALDPSLLLFPRFGNSHADYTSEVRTFYNEWGSFQSVKSFSWMDEYRYSAAPDRRTRRLMEKENKKARDAARKEYNETVRRFVGFVKKRDPRVKKGHQSFEASRKRQQQQSLQRQAQEHKLQEMAKAANYEEQDWEKMDVEDLEEVERMLREEFEYTSDETSDSEFDEFTDKFDDEQFECVVCDKFFKSKNQFDLHEKSKKHKAMVELIREEMVQEGLDLGIDDDGDDGFETAASQSKGSDWSDDEAEITSSKCSEDFDGPEIKFDEKPDVSLDSETSPNLPETGVAAKGNPDQSDAEYDVDDSILELELETGNGIPEPSNDDLDENENFSNRHKSRRGQTLEDELSNLVGGLGVSDDNDWGDDKKKKKKPKKRTQKAAAKISEEALMVSPVQSTETGGSEECLSCHATFSSRNKLFQHMKASGHAAPVTNGKKSKSKKRR